jgi:hypothetical protein
MALEDFKFTELTDDSLYVGRIPAEREKKIKDWLVDNISNFEFTLRTSAFTRDEYDNFIKQFADGIYDTLRKNNEGKNLSI